MHLSQGRPSILLKDSHRKKDFNRFTPVLGGKSSIRLEINVDKNKETSPVRVI